jgi:hypothetical protein
MSPAAGLLRALSAEDWVRTNKESEGSSRVVDGAASWLNRDKDRDADENLESRMTRPQRCTDGVSDLEGTVRRGESGVAC